MVCSSTNNAKDYFEEGEDGLEHPVERDLSNLYQKLNDQIGFKDMIIIMAVLQKFHQLVHQH